MFNALDVWAYLRREGVMYCSLYDAGFTSLGSRDDTERTEELRDGRYAGGYAPAWRLEDGSKERSGRKKKS